jgi:hypothetical protein
MIETLKKKFLQIIEERDLALEEVRISGRSLTAKEAIGNPGHIDYPLQKGKERLMQAEFRGSMGQAFTDMPGNFQGRLARIIGMDLTNNFKRAVLISSINAVMRYLKMFDKSLHCKDKGPVDCSKQLARYIKEEYGKPKIALVGLQPRILEALSREFQMSVMDLDENNIGQKKYGIMIEPPQRTEANLNWCDIALITGTTIVNDTIGEFKTQKPAIFFGVTIAGAARLLDLKHFCPYSL